MAELTAHIDLKKRAAEAARRAAFRADCCRLAAADRAVAAARRLVNLLTAAELLVNGFYEHHGCWRKRKEAT